MNIETLRKYFLKEDDIDIILKLKNENKLNKIINYIEKHNLDNLIWTNIRYPEEIAPGYLISNKGQILTFGWRNTRLLTPLYKKRRKKYCLTLRQYKPLSKNINSFILYREILAQKIFYCNFKELDKKILNNINKYKCVHIDGDLNSFDLNNFHLIDKGGSRESGMTLREILEFRNEKRKTEKSFEQLARNYNVSKSFIYNIYHNKAWIVIS